MEIQVNPWGRFGEGGAPEPPRRCQTGTLVGDRRQSGSTGVI